MGLTARALWLWALLFALLSLHTVTSFAFSVHKVVSPQTRIAIASQVNRRLRQSPHTLSPSTFSPTTHKAHSFALSAVNSDADGEKDTVTDSDSANGVTIRVPTVLLSSKGTRQYVRRSVREKISQVEAQQMQRKAILDTLQVGVELIARPHLVTRFGVYVSPCYENETHTANMTLPQVDLLLQRRTLTAANLSALSWMKGNNANNNDRVCVRVVDVDRAKGHVTAELVKILREDDLSERFPSHEIQRNVSINGTVTRHTEGGMYVFLPKHNVEGLVPTHRLFGQPLDKVVNMFPLNSTITVQMDEVDASKNKLLLNVKIPRADVTALRSIPEERYVDCIVQGVSSFGLFARPAGHDAVGLIHSASIPRELIRALKIFNNMSLHHEVALPLLFHAGDIVKARVSKIDVALNKVDLTMLPLIKEDDSLYLGEHARRVETDYSVVDETMNPLATLVWYKGKRFVAPVDHTKKRRRLLNVFGESSLDGDPDDLLLDPQEITDRNWRRLFTVAHIKRAEEIESTAAQDFADREKKEIGAVAGLEELMPDYFCLDEFKDIFPHKNPIIWKAEGEIPEWFLDKLNGTAFERAYRLKFDEIKYKPFSFETFWGPVFEKVRGERRAKKEERARRRLLRPLSPTDDVVDVPEPSVLESDVIVDSTEAKDAIAEPVMDADSDEAPLETVETAATVEAAGPVKHVEPTET